MKRNTLWTRALLEPFCRFSEDWAKCFSTGDFEGVSRALRRFGHDQIRALTFFSRALVGSRPF